MQMLQGQFAAGDAGAHEHLGGVGEPVSQVLCSISPRESRWVVVSEPPPAKHKNRRVIDQARAVLCPGPSRKHPRSSRSCPDRYPLTLTVCRLEVWRCNRYNGLINVSAVGTSTSWKCWRAGITSPVLDLAQESRWVVVSEPPPAKHKNRHVIGRRKRFCRSGNHLESTTRSSRSCPDRYPLSLTVCRLEVWRCNRYSGRSNGIIATAACRACLFEICTERSEPIDPTGRFPGLPADAQRCGADLCGRVEGSGVRPTRGLWTTGLWPRAFEATCRRSCSDRGSLLRSPLDPSIRRASSRSSNARGLDPAPRYRPVADRASGETVRTSGPPR